MQKQRAGRIQARLRPHHHALGVEEIERGVGAERTVDARAFKPRDPRHNGLNGGR